MIPALDGVLTAGMYDYLLGGGYNFARDRIAAERVLRIVPGAREWARASRAFLRQSVLRMMDAGVRQFVDLGCGVPSVAATHEIATACKVLYVDLDPVVAECNRLHSATEPWADVLEADLRDVDAVLSHPLLDPGQPVGVLMGAVLHEIPHGAAAALAAYHARCAPGSLLAASHVSAMGLSHEQRARLRLLFGRLGITVTARDRDEFASLLGPWVSDGGGVRPLTWAGGAVGYEVFARNQVGAPCACRSFVLV